MGASQASVVWMRWRQAWRFDDGDVKSSFSSFFLEKKGVFYTIRLFVNAEVVDLRNEMKLQSSYECIAVVDMVTTEQLVTEVHSFYFTISAIHYQVPTYNLLVAIFDGYTGFFLLVFFCNPVVILAA